MGHKVNLVMWKLLLLKTFLLHGTPLCETFQITHVLYMMNR